MAEKKALKKASKKSVKKGDAYECGVCGLAVTVDEACGCRRCLRYHLLWRADETQEKDLIT